MADALCLTGCGRPIRSKGRCNRHYLQWLRSTPSEHRKPPTLEERFWSYVRVAGPDECWEWTGAKVNGYGVLSVDRKSTGAPRVSLRLAGSTPSAGDDACHRCDNPPCVNPRHLYFGSRQQNADDAVSRGRVPRGEEKVQRKLSDDAVIEIREKCAAGTVYREVAESYGVSISTVREIAYHQKWKHLGGPIAKKRKKTNA